MEGQEQRPAFSLRGRNVETSSSHRIVLLATKKVSSHPYSTSPGGHERGVVRVHLERGVAGGASRSAPTSPGLLLARL